MEADITCGVPHGSLLGPFLFLVYLTEWILFGCKNAPQDKTSLKICCHGITSKSTVKYLGFELDRYLSGEILANKVISKGNARPKYIYRQSKFVSTKSKKLLASSLIQYATRLSLLFVVLWLI